MGSALAVAAIAAPPPRSDASPLGPAVDCKGKDCVVRWRNNFEAAPSLGGAEPAFGGRASSASSEDASAALAEPPSAGDSDEFGPDLARVRAAFSRRGSGKDKDLELKKLADWDFLPTVGADVTNAFYFGRNPDYAAARGAPAASDDPAAAALLAGVPDGHGSLQAQRFAMALCKHVQFNQPLYAGDCAMCQFLLDALQRQTISCRCYKSKLDGYNYQRCREMKAVLARELPRAELVIERAGPVGQDYTACQALKFCSQAGRLARPGDAVT